MSNRTGRNANRKSANRKPPRRSPQPKLPTKAHVQFGRNIRRLRTRMRLTLSELAAACKLKTDDLERIEEGRLDPSLEVMLRLARQLGVPFSRFFWGVKP